MNFRLPPEIKQVIEDAAAHRGQSISDFAVSTLADAARQILQERHVTRLSARDHKRFLALLDDESMEPNKTLVAAARRYKKTVRS